MPLVIELWSNLDGQIGALYICAIEEHATGIDCVISIHDRYLETIRSGDLATANDAVIEHYIRFGVEPMEHQSKLERTVPGVAQRTSDS